MKKTKKTKPAKKTTKKTTRRTVAAELGSVMKGQLAALKTRKSRHGQGGMAHHKPAVTGEQLGLPKVQQAHVPVKGNPLVAFRHDEKVVNTFVAKFGSRAKAWDDLKRYMSKAVA